MGFTYVMLCTLHYLEINLNTAFDVHGLLHWISLPVCYLAVPLKRNKWQYEFSIL